MTREQGELDLRLEDIRSVATLADLAGLLRRLRRRDARKRGDAQLTYRELATKTGWAHGVIGDYFSGKVLPPTDRFDLLVGLLGASRLEQGELATARDRVEESRRRSAAAPPPAPAVTVPAVPARGVAPVPRELPRDVSAFTGRAAQLAELDRLLADGEQLCALSGTAGVGKTALALRWSHRMADRFPDGCLYVDLRGYADEGPVRPDDALAAFLRSLGVGGADLPPAGPERAGRYRTMLADRRLLVVLDNARSAEQVRPLLPGSSSCFVLVTSRDSLAGLVARDGAHRVDLDRLPGEDAVSLLRRLIGSRVDAEPAAADVLARHCAHLPLALRVAAELAVSRPLATLTEVVADLDGGRLDRLDAGGDPGVAIRGIFSWSYRHLSESGARTFRLLGLHPGRDADLAALAALTGEDPRAAVTELVAAHLVEQVRGERFAMHDLLRGYARERAAEDPPALRRAALDRLVDHYLTASAAATGRDGVGSADGLRWLDGELANLVATVQHGGERPDFAGRLSAILWRYLDAGGHYGEAMIVHGEAARVAAAHGDLAGEAAALGELGQVHARLGHYQQAREYLERVLVACRSLDDPVRENATHNSLAMVCSRLGRFEEALGHLRRALELDRATGNRPSEGKVLSNLGIVHALLGRFHQAREQFTMAVDVAREVGDRTRESEALNNLGLIDTRLGEPALALRRLQAGLAIARAAGDVGGEGRLLANIGVARVALGDRRTALDTLDRALRVHRRIGDRAAEAETLGYLADAQHAGGDLAAARDSADRALRVAGEIGERSVVAATQNTLGRVLLAAGEPGPAAARHREAAAVATAIGDRYQLAAAREGLGDCLAATGDPGSAEQWRRALADYTELGVPDAVRLRSRRTG